MLEMGYPVFTQRADGACFWDVDGNEYLDFLLGFGPILLGYNDPAVNAALGKQITEGTVFSTAHPKELEVAQMLIDRYPGCGDGGFSYWRELGYQRRVASRAGVYGQRESHSMRLSRLAFLDVDRATPAYRQASPS